MHAKTGDRIVVESAHVGQPRREGEVLEVVRGERDNYRVRWDDGDESIYFPRSDCRVVGRVRDRRTSPESVNSKRIE
jgi:Domain of unknown function (DUF1918)